MKNIRPILTIIVLSLLSSCNLPINNPQTVKIKGEYDWKSKKIISGRVEFPDFNKLTNDYQARKAISENTIITLLYTSDHKQFPNKIVATTLADASGKFIIEVEKPSFGYNFILKASKKIGKELNSTINLKTRVEWYGDQWKSISAPEIVINSKTTATLMLDELLKSYGYSIMDTVEVSNGISKPLDILNDSRSVIIPAKDVIEFSKVIDNAIANNYEPSQYISYSHYTKKFTIKDPHKNILNEQLGLHLGDTYPAIYAQLKSPTDVTFDFLGNMYIVDSENNRIRKVDTNAVITTVAGGAIGDNYPARNAVLSVPDGIALDNNENLYIAEEYGHRVRKVDKNTGVITTIAGDGLASESNENIEATNAHLKGPSKLFFDNLNNLYIYNSNKISKVNSNGFISTLVKNKVFSNDNYISDLYNMTFYNVKGINFDKQGNTYFIESSKIIKFDTNHSFSTFAGGGKLSEDGIKATNAIISIL